MAEGETKLRERIEAWDRPGMRAAQAIDAGRVASPAPLLDRLKARQTPEVQEAAEKAAAAFISRAHHNHHSTCS